MKKDIKKNIITSGIISIIINTICLIINLVCSLTINTIPLGISFAGGDCIEHIGFGIYMIETFVFGLKEEFVGTSTSIEFNLISLLVPLILIFIITFVIMIIISKRNNNKK